MVADLEFVSRAVGVSHRSKEHGRPGVDISCEADNGKDVSRCNGRSFDDDRREGISGGSGFEGEIPTPLVGALRNRRQNITLRSLSPDAKTVRR